MELQHDSHPAENQVAQNKACLLTRLILPLLPHNNTALLICRALAALKVTRRVLRALRATKALVLEVPAQQEIRHPFSQALVQAPTLSQATLDLGLAMSLAHALATSQALALDPPTSTTQDRHWQTRV